MRISRWALLLVITGFLALAAAEPPRAVAADATFLDTSASATFQDSITFTLVAEADSPIVAVALFWQPVGDPELQAAFPAVEPDLHVELEHVVDTSVNYLPPGLDLTYRWRVTEQDGDVTESEPATLFYMDDSQSWQTLTDGLVTLYWYRGNDKFARDIVDTALRGISQLSDRFAIDAEEPVRLVIYGDERAFNRALPPNSAEWIGGQAHPTWGLIVAEIDPGSGAETEVRRMVPHEISHLVVYQATRNPFNSPPSWLDEGLAVFNQEVPDSRFAAVLSDAIDDGRLIPLRALNSSFPTDPDQAILSYAQSGVMVEFIAEEYGDGALGQLVAIFRDEVSIGEAVQGSLGVTIDELDAGWRASVGYDGDATPEPQAPDGDATDDELSTNELIGLLVCTGIGALIGLGIAVGSLIHLRRLKRS